VEGTIAAGEHAHGEAGLHGVKADGAERLVLLLHAHTVHARGLLHVDPAEMPQLRLREFVLVVDPPPRARAREMSSRADGQGVKQSTNSPPSFFRVNGPISKKSFLRSNIGGEVIPSEYYNHKKIRVHGRFWIGEGD
jgi:hypothetical protein